VPRQNQFVGWYRRFCRARWLAVKPRWMILNARCNWARPCSTSGRRADGDIGLDKFENQQSQRIITVVPVDLAASARDFDGALESGN
jgi:hypothetical protein